MFVPVVSGIDKYGDQLGGVEMQVYGPDQTSFGFSTDGLNEDVVVQEKESDSTSNDPEGAAKPEPVTDRYEFNIDSLIATFIYNIEAFALSQCEKEPDQRAVYVAEGEILLVRKNTQSSSGYEFVVKPCELTNTVHGVKIEQAPDSDDAQQESLPET